jgi:crossover junction endodeoxyribonuclease RuvC
VPAVSVGPAPASRLRILGIDPGTLRLGYGVIDHFGPGRDTYVDCGVITAPARASRDARLLTIGRDLRELVSELGPDVAAMEQAFFGKNVQATLALGEARGVALFVTQDSGVAIVGYAPARVKQTIVGHGQAGKHQVGFLVKAMLKLKRPPEADAADALAIALCHARFAGSKLATERRAHA